MASRTAPRLADLGDRICIIGPSNSGKSTLAVAIGAARGLPVIHLDRLYHLPHTDWTPRPEDEFLAQHAQAIAGPRWVIDGNYSRCLPRRLARASGLIVLDVATATSLARYVRRTLFERERSGGLDGAGERLKWAMVRHIAIATRANRGRYAKLGRDLPLPQRRLGSLRAIARFYAAEGLRRPSAPYEPARVEADGPGG